MSYSRSTSQSPHLPRALSHGFHAGGVRLLALVASLLGCLSVVPCLHAYPPAPYYTIHGMVRDQVGNTLVADGAQIILLRDGAELGRAPITGALLADRNYELRIRIDQNRAATRSYSTSAVPSAGLYSLAVDIDGRRFYPIEVAGNLRAGQGGERVQLDLNLGADTDGDGLPDAWEEWQLYQLGEYPGSAGWDLSRVDRDGDLDGDGANNFLEYVAGTFAGDATERFDLKLRAISGGVASFEFFAITGKVYRIEASEDLVNWVEIPFSVGTPAHPRARFHRAADVAVLPAYADHPATAKQFYRLTVR
jgi:hypothetical protein